MTEEKINIHAAQYWRDWQDEMNKLNHVLFFGNIDAGKRWLKMMEERYFYAPVADPNVDVAFAYYNEGRNSFIRGIRVSAYAAMQPHEPQTMQKDLDYERIENENG